MDDSAPKLHAEKYTLDKNLVGGWHHLPLFYDDHRVSVPNMGHCWELFNTVGTNTVIEAYSVQVQT